MLSKILAGFAAIAAFVAMFFKAKAAESEKARVEDREAVKDKAKAVQKKSTDARYEGQVKEDQARSKPIDEIPDEF